MKFKEVLKKVKRREGVYEDLVKLLGKRKVSASESVLFSYSHDYWPISLHWIIHGEIPALPDVVVFPESLEDVVKVVKYAYEKSIPIIPYGGGSGVLGAAVPEYGGIVIDMKRMKRIKIYPKDLIAEAEAGVVGMTLEMYLNHKGFTLRNIPQSLYPSTLGGWIATKALGQFSTKYGGIEDMVIGIEAVIPPGDIVHLKPHPRTATGPDLRKIFIGAEGTLGIVTKAYLKIWPLPERVYKLSFMSDSIEEALESIRRVLQRGVRPAVVRLFDDIETIKWYYWDKKVKKGKVVTIFIVEGDKKLADAEKEIIEEEFRNAIPLGEEPVNYWLEHRFDVREMSEFVPLGFVIDTIEIALPWSKAAEGYHRIINAIRSVEGTLIAYAHASHVYPQGTCFYFIFAGWPKDRDPNEYYQEVWEAAMKATLESGGTISHHHGVGRMRKRWFKDELGEGGFELLRRIKRAIDEKGILNPGNLGV